MRLLDQRRHPARFTVVTSTVSGLVVLAVSEVAGTVFRLQFLTTTVPLWSLLAVIGALVAMLSVVWTSRRAATHRAKRVFLVVSAFNQKHYVAELIRNIHGVLERRGYSLEIMIPHCDYSTVSQAHCLERVARQRDSYVGGFVFPVYTAISESSRRDLTEFCENVDMPVVFIDIEPFDDQQTYPSRTSFVGYHDGEIGEAAAQWTAQYLLRLNKARPTVLVISGMSHHQREQRFKDQLKAAVDDVQIIDDNAEFDRLRAREVTRKQLRQAQRGGQKVDVIFCTNDEMALGAVDALFFAGGSTARETLIVGVDGTPEAKALIEAGPNPFRATVTQDSYKVAETAVDLLERTLRGGQVPKRTYLRNELFTRD